MRDDGGPAFPNMEQWNDRIEDYANRASEGMTLRDYFAAKAMADVLNHFNWTDDSIAEAAEMAYRLADAMLAERAK